MSTDARSTYVTKNVRNMAPEIRDAVIQATKEQEVTISDIVGKILSRAWDIPYELSSQTASWFEATGNQINVRIPQEMAQRIWVVSRARGITESSLVQHLIAEEFEIPYEPVVRGGARRGPRA